jgi:hypothetical protein
MREAHGACGRRTLDIVQGGALAIAIIQADEHPTAAPFYKFAPKELVAPSGVMKITTRYRLTAMTAMKVFAQISRYASDKGEVLVVCHGTPVGPAIPLITYPEDTDGSALQQNAIVVLNDPSLTEDDAAHKLFMTTPQLRAFRAALEKVRKKKLKRIEFRACDVGADAATLQALRDFLGADVVGGPTQKDAYSPKFTFPKGYSKEDFAAWQTEHPQAVIESTPHGDFGYDARKASDVAFSFAWNAESAKALKAWVAARFPSARRPGKPTAVHGFFLPDDSLVFPLPDYYLSNLAVS